ncbi:glycoside hydrolase [Rhizodiscina lignyota]|uniref:Glycoside hydrolase n=1 Tax=Rhizodiscina lignyota TaxID=1504668 RepID=A0A9P4MA23_9PEZI|nr:glycoside hydrolase [Rhizodiscina lignyota]
MDQGQVDSWFSKLPPFGIVRSYGVDCNQVSTMISAAKANNMKVFLGIFDLSQASSEISTLISGVNGDWSGVWAVSIGNEDVNQGKAAPADVVTALNNGRTQLRSAGYNGPVVHVDTFNQIIDHPEMCENSDFAAANCHAFFDPNTSAQNAGDFVLNQAQQVAKACGGKNTWITESGWPHAGLTNGQAVPSPENQQDALNSLRSKFSSNIIFFSAFNDLWKVNNAGTFDAEQCWGMFDSDIKGF